jgi:hypothetical protein
MLQVELFLHGGLQCHSCAFRYTLSLHVLTTGYSDPTQGDSGLYVSLELPVALRILTGRALTVSISVELQR